MQIKITTSYHDTPAQTAEILKDREHPVLARMWSNGSSHTPQVGVGDGTTMLENFWKYLLKLNIHTFYVPAILLLDLYQQNASSVHQETHTRVFVKKMVRRT